MKTCFQHKLKFLTVTVAVNALMMGTVQADTIGREVINVADVTYTMGDTRIRASTNEATFVIEPPRVDPTIQFYRYSPNAPNPDLVQINGSEYSPSGNVGGPFQSSGDPVNTGTLLDLSGPVPLIPADRYLSGELMFIQVDYVTANTDDSVIDTVVITVEADSGDLITLRLYESAPDSGQFWAFLPSTSQTTLPNDPLMTAGVNDGLVATFINTNSNVSGNVSVKVVADTAVINPHNTVFDAVTGDPVNGAIVRLIDLTTGQLADVSGIDGFSEFPSEYVSGETVEDASGLRYEMEDGLFTFPSIQTGQYAVEVTPPEGYLFASSLQPDQINSLTGAAYFIVDGSYGQPFEIDTLSSLRFDIPLDPASELSVTKVADRSHADVGDFINYTVTVQNLGSSSVPINLFDTLPRGFRYLEGTTLQNDLVYQDPEVSNSGTDLSFDLGVLPPNTTIELDYALRVGPGGFATGEAINSAVVLDGAGRPVSNVGRASVKLREDILRSRSTIVGRISQDSCNGEQDWARDIDIGAPVEGVRLYMETGAHAVSDQDGLFHFEGVKEGTHVVQIDEETLPSGYEPMVCEENSRYAGSANSKFVAIQGGGIWKANFYLKKTLDIDVKEDVTDAVHDQTEYKSYDTAWLEKQNSGIEWAYPLTTPSIPSANIGIKHGVGETISLELNEKPVSPLNYEGRDSNSDQSVMLSRWKGIDLQKGKNRFNVTVKDSNGQIVRQFDHDLHFATDIDRVSGVPDRSILVADGRTHPQLAIRLEDASGHAVNAGRVVKVDVVQPYQLASKDRLFRDNDLLDPLSARADVTVGADGIALVKLEPTLQTGKVSIMVTLDNGRIVPIHMYLEPEKRDWIIVGLAEGSAGYQTIKDKSITFSNSDQTISDDRVAFFAKGMIKGEWLMTVAVDTDKTSTDRDGGFLQEIDPNAYYTLYGDRSYQEYEGQSRYPVYLKLEKKSAYALFGDYDTNLTEGRLSAYNRRLSGLKAEYVGEKFQVMGFAAETNQGFALDEIPANGTTGFYYLKHDYILDHSENIVVETRDRNRPDIVLERREMRRFLDYTIDYLTGDIVFRLPVDATDVDFNPNVIVATYETTQDAERNVTFGGRAQTQLLGDKVQIGATFVQEDGSALTSGAKQNLMGVDAVANVTDNTEVRLEYAVSEDVTDPKTTTQDAILAEVIHTSENISAQAYFREEQGGFGLGQRQSNTNGVRRYGASANFKLNEFDGEHSGQRGSQTIEGQAYHVDNLETGDSRDSLEVKAKHSDGRISVAGGLRAVKDNFVERDDRQSVLAIAQASLSVPKHDVRIQLSHEQPLGDRDDVSAFPQRTALSLDKTFANKINASVRHELLDGNGVKSQNTVFGVSAAPWTGSNVTASTDYLTDESGRRLGATIGLDQQIRLDEKWSLSAGLRNRHIIDGEATEYLDVAPDAAVSPFETNQDFSSGYIGLGYRTEAMTGSARIEGRNSSEGKTWIGSAAVARELSEDLSLAGALRSTFHNPNGDLGSTEQVDARVGAAWRPRDEDTVIFDRFDYGFKKDQMGYTKTKLVNNLAANQMLANNWQVTANHGVKYVKETIAGQEFETLTNLVGMETRYDISRKIDLGLRGQATFDDNGAVSYSYGPSIGVSPVKDIWVSAGYNFKGYSDDDFEASEYSKEGVYLKLRVKFDQHTARGLLGHISPTSVDD